jgi:hypothetical protein
LKLDIIGYIWICLGIYINNWIQSDTFSLNLIYMLIQLDMFGYIYKQLDTIGYKSIHLETYFYFELISYNVSVPNHVVKVNLTKN